MSKQCWICHEESEAALLTHLCRCHGNTGSAHPKCINRWVLGTVDVKNRFGSDLDDTPTLANVQEGAFVDSDLEAADDDDDRLRSHPNCSICGELYQIKCVQMVREDNIPLDGSNALHLLVFLVRRLLLPLCGRLLLVTIAVSLLFVLLPWIYGLVFIFAHGSRACIHQRALKTVPFIRFPPLLSNPCAGSHYFRGDVILSAHHAHQLDMCNQTATIDEGICPVAFPLLECNPIHAFPFVLFYQAVQFYWQWVPSHQLTIVRLLEAIAWAHDDVFYFDIHYQASNSWKNIMWLSVLKPWSIGLVAAISYRAMSRNFVSFIQFIRQYHTRNGRRNVPQYFPKLDLEESLQPPIPPKMTLFAIHDNPQLPNPPLLLRLLERADAVLQHCDCLSLVSQSSKASALCTFVLQRVAVEVFIVTAWWFTLVSCPESWIPAIVVVSSVSLSIRALKPPIPQPNRRYFDPFAYILQWGCESHSTDVLVWYCAYVGEVIVFWLVLPVLGGFVVQQALAPYFANYYPIVELLQGDISVFYLPSLGMVLWYFVVGNIYLLVLIEVEGRVVMPLFAPGIHLYFMRAVNFNSSKINKKLLMGWKFVFCHIYDSDPLFMVWELFTTGVCELTALYCFLRTPCMMTGLLAQLLPNLIIDVVASPPDYSQMVCTTGPSCFFESIVSWHNGLVVMLAIQLVCCITSVYPTQRVFLRVAYPLSESIGGLLGISHILFNEERRAIVRQWLGEETSEGLDGRLPQISLNQMPSMRDNEAYQEGGWALRLQCLGVGALFLMTGCIVMWTPIVTSWVLLAPLLTSAGLESRAIAALSALLTPFFIYDPKMFVVAGAMSGAVVVSIPLCLLEIIWHAVSRLSLPSMPTSTTQTRSQAVAPQRCALLRWTWVKYLLRCAVERGQQFSSTVVSKQQ